MPVPFRTRLPKEANTFSPAHARFGRRLGCIFAKALLFGKESRSTQLEELTALRNSKAYCLKGIRIEPVVKRRFSGFCDGLGKRL